MGSKFVCEINFAPSLRFWGLNYFGSKILKRCYRIYKSLTVRSIGEVLKKCESQKNSEMRQNWNTEAEEASLWFKWGSLEAWEGLGLESIDVRLASEDLLVVRFSPKEKNEQRLKKVFLLQLGSGGAASGQKLCVLPGAESVYEKFIRGWIQRRIHSLPDSTKFAQLAWILNV